MNLNFKDCFARFDGVKLVLGNAKIEREISFEKHMPISLHICADADKRSCGRTVMFNIGDFDFENAQFTQKTYVDTMGGKSEEALFVELEYISADTQIKQVFYCFPEICAISSALYLKGKTLKTHMDNVVINAGIEKENNKAPIVVPEYGVVDMIHIGNNHTKLTTIRVLDETDAHNELVTETEYLLYKRAKEYYNGSIFVLDDYVQDKAIMLVSENYVTGKKFNIQQDLVIDGAFAGVYGDAFDAESDTYTYIGGATLVMGKKRDLPEVYKSFYTKLYRCEENFIMSNTWGDRNRDCAVCEEFILKEIDMAEKLGVDILQIDDGWQKGLTANSGFVQNGPWGDFYDADKNFWDVNPDKFPRGLSPVAQYAAAKGIKLGLWFAMDKGDNYAKWQVDAQKVLDLHREYDVTYFKIDGLQIVNPTCEQNIKNFAAMVDQESAGKINFNFDITAHRRFGYFLHKQYSTLFVENRYTDFASYYPFRTLRNVWSLSKYFPCHKFQFELLNEKRNADKYAQDSLRPSAYSIDYLFASVMVTNPLVWMEMTGLDGEQTEKLNAIISVYKQERMHFVGTQILPIGERPDGMSYTGFHVKGKDFGYLILLKEYAKEDSYTYEIENSISAYSVLATNAPDAEINVNANRICVNNIDKFSYLFIKYDAHEK